MIDYKDERNAASESEKIYPVFSRTRTFFPVRIQFEAMIDQVDRTSAGEIIIGILCAKRLAGAHWNMMRSSAGNGSDRNVDTNIL